MALQPRQCAPSSSSTIHLDHGVDSAPFDPRDLRVSSRGLSLPSRWRFEPGAEISVNFQLDDGTGTSALLRPATLRTTGVVVDCEPDAQRAGVFWLTLLFLESTDDVLTLVQALADYRARLAAESFKPSSPASPGSFKPSSPQTFKEVPKVKVQGPSFEL